MEKNEALPGLKAILQIGISNSLINIDKDLADDYYWDAYSKAFTLGIVAVEHDANCPTLLKLYRLEHAFNEGYDFELETKQAAEACSNCDQKYGQCYSGCPWV